MSDIDFLATKKPDDDQELKNQDDKKEKIIWSEPDENKPLVKEAPFHWLSFFKRKEPEKPASPAGGPATGPAVDKSSTIYGKVLDKNKIRESRREILKLIEHNESLAGEKKPDKNLLAGLIEKFKKQPDHKEALIDYQSVFGQEKNKRSWPSEQVRSTQTGRANEVEPVKPARLAESRRARPAKEFKPGFLSRFFKMIKDKIAALSQSKLRPPKNNMTEIFQEDKLKTAKPQPAKPARLADSPRFAGAAGDAAQRAGEKEAKIKAKPPEKAGPARLAPATAQRSQIKEEPLEVLETNLIKGEIITFFDWRKKSVILINAILIPVFLIAVIYFGLMFYQKQNQAKIQNQAKQANELTLKIKQAEVGLKEITEFQARLKMVSQIFAQHIYWTNFFKFLEDSTIKDVYYAGFSGDTSGDYSLEATGAKFSNISEQVGILRNNQQVTDVRTAGGEFTPGDAANKTGVKFNLNFSILKNIFID